MCVEEGAFKGVEGGRPSVSKSGRDGSISFIFSSITSHIFGDGKSICGSPMSLLVLREMIKKTSTVSKRRARKALAI